MPTVTSETAVANLALQHLGQRRISDLPTATDKAGLEIRAVFPVVRQALLREHGFAFAEDTVELQRLAQAPVNRWAYAYQLPTDFIRAIAINDDDAVSQDEFELASEGRLLTDAETVDLHYVKDVENVTRWDALFVEAIALAVAVKVCKVITGDEQLRASLVTALQSLALPNAKQASAREGRAPVPWHHQQSRLARSRGYSSMG